MNNYIKTSTGTDFFLIESERPADVTISISLDGQSYEIVKTYSGIYSLLVQMNLKEGINIKFSSSRPLTITQK